MTTVGHDDEQPTFSEQQLLWLDLHWGDRLQAGATPHNQRDPQPLSVESRGQSSDQDPPPGQLGMQQQGILAL